MYHYNTLMRYTQAKREALKLADLLQHIDPKGAQNMRECGHQITVGICPACGMVHVQAARTCKHRLCPQCQLRKARKIAANLKEVMRRIDAITPAIAYVPLHVTLTQRNIRRGSLRAELQRILDGITKMRYCREYRRDAIGWIRKIEITYNAAKKTWHPHVHLLLLAAPGSRLTDKTWWQTLWATCMGNLNYAPQINVRIVADQKSAIYEVAKYVTKPAIFDDVPKQQDAIDLLRELLDATSNKQLLGFGGLIARVRKKMQDEGKLLPEDASEDDMATTGCKHTEMQRIVMEWYGAEYKLRDILNN